MPFYLKILIAIILAVVAGSVTPEDSVFYQTYDFIGTLFLNGLKMIVIPLITASIICAVMDVSKGDFGKLGSMTAALYVATTAAAVTFGLFIVNVLKPGVSNSEELKNILGSSAENIEKVENLAEGKDYSDILEIFHRMVPDNLFQSAVNNEILGLIFFSILFGYFISRLDGEERQLLQKFWRAIYNVIMKITNWILLFAPIGVFGLVAKIITTTGFSSFLPMLLFMVTVISALAFHVLVVHSSLLYFGAGIHPIHHMKAMLPALLTAFSTASSSATLPVTIDCITKRVGVSARTSGFVLPMGTTLNMDGTALYECIAVMFIAQVYGIDLSFLQQVIIVITALLTSAGVAGIPSASLVAITLILTTLGLPLEGIALLLITDRVLDMLRTATNVYGDSVVASVVAIRQKETLHYGQKKSQQAESATK